MAALQLLQKTFCGPECAQVGADCWGAEAEEADGPIVEGLASTTGASSNETAPVADGGATKRSGRGTGGPARKKMKSKDMRKQVKQALLHISNVTDLCKPFVHLIRVKRADDEEHVKTPLYHSILIQYPISNSFVRVR